jgi:chromosome segregation ATPase
MHRPRPFALTAAVLGLSAGAWTCAAQETDADALHDTIAAQQTRIDSLEKSLVQANRAEKEASEQLATVKLRLEALGRDLLDGGDDRLVDANADLEILRRRSSELEAVSSRLVGVVTEYLRQAVAADPDARLRVETAMRELDEVLGLRQKPAPAAAAGSAGQAKVVTIDSVSGLLVLNVGESQTARIGTTYRLVRGEQSFGTAIVADVRRNVCGAFVEELDPGQGPVRLGDSALLITE